MMAFAAGIGETGEIYFDDTRDGGLVGHPGLVFPFHWNSRETPGVEVPPVTQRRSVHAYSDIQYERAFRQGDVITCQAETVTVRKVPPGAIRVQRAQFTDDRGRRVAEMDYANIFRGVGLDGPDAWAGEPQTWPDGPDADTSPAWEAEVAVGRTVPHLYTEGGDLWNPIHTERSVALAAGLPDIILQGSATLLLALHEVVDRRMGGGPTGLRRLAGRFRAMVIPGSSIVVRCLAERRSSGRREFFFDVRNAEGAPAIERGYAAFEV